MTRSSQHGLGAESTFTCDFGAELPLSGVRRERQATSGDDTVFAPSVFPLNSVTFNRRQSLRLYLGRKSLGPVV